MARCAICDKGVSFGIKVSHSHRRSNRTWKPNIKKVRVNIDGTSKRLPICTGCLRTSLKSASNE